MKMMFLIVPIEIIVQSVGEMMNPVVMMVLLVRRGRGRGCALLQRGRHALFKCQE